MWYDLNQTREVPIFPMDANLSEEDVMQDHIKYQEIIKKDKYD